MLIKILKKTILIQMLWIGFFTPSFGQLEEAVEGESPYLLVPYAFYSETLEWSVGAMGGVKDLFQEETSIRFGGLISSNESYFAYGVLSNFKLPYLDRLLFTGDFRFGRFGLIKSYSDGNFDFRDKIGTASHSGGNDSDPDNYLGVSGLDNTATLFMRYVLPFGHGRKAVLANGSQVNGGSHWSPFFSGRTMLEVNPFYRGLSVTTRDATADGSKAKIEMVSSGLQFALTHENMDYRDNPSTGSYKQLMIRRDFGLLENDVPWTVVELSYAKYFSLTGLGDRQAPKVLALNFWTANCLTWNSSHKSGSERVFHRAPYHSGANLGGLFRMRGYSSGRFNDRAAIYYAAEYRHTCRWNDLRDSDLLQKLNINVDWIQFVAFLEAGRVNDVWDVTEIHEAMKWDAGGGVRLSVNGIVVRIDVAASEEEVAVQMFYDHPFFLR